MAPASIIVRLTNSLVAGYTRTASSRKDKLPDVIDDILKGDCGYAGKEFYLGGEIVKRGLPDDKTEALEDKGVTLERDPRELLQSRRRQGAGRK